METTFYDDNNLSIKKMKTNMTLDFSSTTTKQEKFGDFLTTPDVGLFMISTPELERLISHQQGNMVLTTPTPTSQILFPKTVTEEQEAYARGFIDALGELQKNDTALVSSPTISSSQNCHQNSVSQDFAFNQPTSTLFNVPQSTSLKTVNAAALNNMLSYNNANSSASFTNQLTSNISKISKPSVAGGQSQSNAFSNSSSSQMSLKTESFQTVPLSPPGSSYSSQPSPINMSQSQVIPINMEDQEMAKLERKRARNRIAATKCRNRKLERIARLEERVKELKEQNLDLAQTASLLREQVFKLKQTIIEHTQHGCQVMLTSKFLDSNAILS